MFPFDQIAHVGVGLIIYLMQFDKAPDLITRGVLLVGLMKSTCFSKLNSNKI